MSLYLQIFSIIPGSHIALIYGHMITVRGHMVGHVIWSLFPIGWSLMEGDVKIGIMGSQSTKHSKDLF